MAFAEERRAIKVTISSKKDQSENGKIENRKIMKENQGNKSWFFEKIGKIHKSLAVLIRNAREMM